MSVRALRVLRHKDLNHTFSLLVERNNVPGALLFQNGAILQLDTDAWETERANYKKIVDAYGLMGVLRISKDESLLVLVTGVLSVGQLYGTDVAKVTGVEFLSLRSPNISLDPRLPDLKILLCSGMFYFSNSPQFDITSCSQRRALGLGSDPRFFWNRSLHFLFNKYGIDTSQWLLKCIAGSVVVKTVYVGHRTGRVALVSRLSCERVGTRFNVRGANYLGHVANFIETEQLIVFDDRETSLVQVRGSIPLFWDQPGVQVGSHKVKLRAFEATSSAYHRHLAHLEATYGDFAIVHLLGNKEGERMLSDAFKTRHDASGWNSRVELIHFDYHGQTRISRDAINLLRKKLEQHVNKHGFFVSEPGKILRKQTGVLRTNCLDCLDRTNAVQTMVGLQSVKTQVASLGLENSKVNVEQRIEEVLKDLWQKNGDQCSTIYAGTGALDGKSKLKDAGRSLARTIQNNLMDAGKQESFDLFLAGSAGDPRLFERAASLLPASIMHEYAEAVNQVVVRNREVTSNKPIKVFIGTWNVNGGKNMHNIAFRNEAKLSDWIFPSSNLVMVSDLDEAADIVAIGVEELVDLNASNMVKASTTNQRLWADGLRKTLQEKNPYVHVASEQLVGVCLFLFVRPRLVPFVKDFGVASVKTGMGGATGNKGSVAFRLVVHSTSLCFVCSHFAAGQNEVRDRNEDYTTAMRKLRFPYSREIDAHDVIFWLGDFNYRINLTGDEVKLAVQNGQLDQLVPNDQLTQQRAEGKAFDGFEEGRITFAPTYKYDTFSDDYDTSEKCRTPAWTDRILWKEQRMQQDTQLIRYYRSELKTSDHRPVGALFSVDLRSVDPLKIPVLVQDIVNCMGPPDATVIFSVPGKPRFPHQAFEFIGHKIRDLHANILLSKYEGSDLWIVLESGESALAVLSMDAMQLPDGNVLSVRLRSPLWSDELDLQVSELDVPTAPTQVDEEVPIAATAFDFDEDDDELCSMSVSTALDASRPASARSESLQPLAELDWPTENRSASTTNFNTVAASNFQASPPTHLPFTSNTFPPVPAVIPSQPAPVPPPPARISSILVAQAPPSQPLHQPGVNGTNGINPHSGPPTFPPPVVIPPRPGAEPRMPPPSFPPGAEPRVPPPGFPPGHPGLMGFPSGQPGPTSNPFMNTAAPMIPQRDSSVVNSSENGPIALSFSSGPVSLGASRPPVVPARPAPPPPPPRPQMPAIPPRPKGY